MKKIMMFVILFVPLSLFADNVIFNGGFDMVPWDTGWVKEITIDTSSYGDGHIIATAEIDSSSLVVSSPRSCNLRTYAKCWNTGGIYGSASATVEASITQMFSPISNCLFKVYGKWFNYFGGKNNKYTSIGPNLCINGEWRYIWGGGIYTNWTEICTTVTSPDTVTGIKFVSYSQGGGAGTAGWGTTNYNYIYIDNVQITETGIEENTNKENAELEIIKEKIYLSVPNTIQADIKLYDLCGRLKKVIYIGTLSKGNYTFTPDINVSGIYFVKFVTDNYKKTKKLILMK